jgi:hypothetical protein
LCKEYKKQSKTKSFCFSGCQGSLFPDLPASLIDKQIAQNLLFFGFDLSGDFAKKHFSFSIFRFRLRNEEKKSQI